MLEKYKNELKEIIIKQLYPKCKYIPAFENWYLQDHHKDYVKISSITHIVNNDLSKIWERITENIKKIETFDGELDNYYFKVQKDLLEFIKSTLLNKLNHVEV
jgi:hypothetical protein